MSSPLSSVVLNFGMFLVCHDISYVANFLRSLCSEWRQVPSARFRTSKQTDTEHNNAPSYLGQNAPDYMLYPEAAF